jgi:dTDP-4-amino-4,6-dideoxygalactose transaminase
MARPVLGEEEQEAVRAVLAGGGLAQGPVVAEFEEAFSGLVDGRECVAVSSGTAALHLALLANGIGAGDEVVVPSFTFAATANAVRLAGAEPVFADIDPSTFCLDPGAVAAAVGPRTAAVLPVHLYGQPADMAALGEVARRHGLLVVEDAAQAHAAADGGRPVGALGAAAAFSFYATKNMTTGEGGMVVTADHAVARTVRLLRNQGMERPYENEMVGFNLRMTDIAAAIGLVQLRRLPALTERRQANARALDDALAGHGQVVPPARRVGTVHVYHQYTVRSGGRDLLQRRLDAEGVESRVHYPTPVHRLAPFAGSKADLPETDRAAAEVLSIPVGPHLTDADVAAVAAAVAR